jgi:hypothetical protein
MIEPEAEITENAPQESVLADLRQAWREAMTGSTLSISQVWENIQKDTDNSTTQDTLSKIRN